MTLPLFQQTRLQEARRLMFGEDLDAASAGLRVGYDDPSYFSRVFRRKLHLSPQTYRSRFDA